MDIPRNNRRLLMTVGEKIKSFRNIRGISQKALGELAEINEVTIRKYELGDRNPKPDQLLKIANALGVSINVFMDFDIVTASDVLTLLFKMDEQTDLTFDGKTDKDGKIKPDTLTIRFKHKEINERLAKWAYAKKQLDGLKSRKDDFPSVEAYEKELAELENTCEEIKQHLLDSNMVVKKDTEGIVVKMANWY